MRCSYEGQTYSRAAHIWVDKDFAMARGHLQGYPKKMGDIWLTRAVTIGKAGPRLEPGGRFGATLSTWGRRIADARFTITGTSRQRRVRQRPPDDALAPDARHRMRRDRQPRRARHHARLRRRARSGLRGRRRDRPAPLPHRGAPPARADRDDRRLLAPGRQLLERRHDPVRHAQSESHTERPTGGTT